MSAKYATNQEFLNVGKRENHLSFGYLLMITNSWLKEYVLGHWEMERIYASELTTE